MKKNLSRLMAILLMLGMIKDPFLLVAHALEEQEKDPEWTESSNSDLNVADIESFEELEDNSSEIVDEEPVFLNDSLEAEELKNEISTKKIEIQQKKEEMANRVSEEIALGNNPVVSWDGLDVFAFFEEVFVSLDRLITEVNEENYLVFSDEFYEQVSKVEMVITSFYEKNLSLLDLGLLEQSEDLYQKYLQLVELRNHYLLIHQISTMEEVVHMDLELVSFYQELVLLADNYADYKKAKDDYLTRRPSDREMFDDERVDQLALSYSKDQAILEIKSILNNPWSNEEVSYYDVLLELDLASDLNQAIEEKKLAFYEISFLENLYDLKVRNNKIIVSQEITKEELLSYVVSNGNLECLEENGLVLVVYDSNHKEVQRYVVVLKNDWNEDGIVDEADQKLLAEAIVTNSNDLRYDLNNDGKIDYEDFLVIDEETTNVSFHWASYEEDGKMYYELRMENGRLSSFYLSLITNENLEFEKVLGCEEAVIDQKNPQTMLGYHLTSDTVTLVYRIKNVLLEKRIAIETLASDKVDVYQHILAEKVIEKLQDTSSLISTSYSSYGDESVVEEVLQQEDKRNDKKEEDVQKQDKTSSELKKEEVKITTWNIIKIVIIVFLGAIIVYLMNKKEIQENFLEDNKKEDSSSVK